MTEKKRQGERSGKHTCESLRVLFEAWAEPQFKTLARYRGIESELITYRIPEIDLAWNAFNAGANAVCGLREEQRKDLEFE